MIQATRNFFLMLFLAFVHATQLRFEGFPFPFGASEIFYLLALVATTFLFFNLRHNEVLVDKYKLLVQLSAFWVIIWPMTLYPEISMITGLSIFYSGIVVLFAIKPNPVTLLKSGYVFMSLLLALLLYNLLFDVQIIVFTHPTEGFRFTGAAENPNQLALSFLFFYFVFLYNYKINPSKMLFVSIVVIFIFSLTTLSDALYLSLLVFMIILMLSKVKNVFFRVLITLSLLLFALYLVYFVFSEGLIYESRQAEFRMILWENGWKAFMESPFIGNGLSAHSGAYGPFQAMETHNIFIDLYSQVGLLGGSVFFILLLFIFISIYAVQNVNFRWLLYGFFFSLLTFGMFHYILRNPIFWISLYLILFYSKNYNKNLCAV